MERAFSPKQVAKQLERIDLDKHSAEYTRLHYDARIEYCRARLKEVDGLFARLQEERASLLEELSSAPAKKQEAERKEKELHRAEKHVKAQPMLAKLAAIKAQLDALGIVVK